MDKEQINELREGLKNLVKIALDGKTMGISVSDTDFGTSIYLQDTNVKMRFSDHSVGYKRFNEDCWELSSILENKEAVILAIKENFNENYTNLLIEADDRIFPVRRVLKSDLKNWDQVIVESTKEIPRSILINEIDTFNVIKNTGLTKKKNKYNCVIEVPAFNRGVQNKITNQIISVYSPTSPISGLKVVK